MKRDVKAVNVTGRDERPNKPGEYCFTQYKDEKQMCGMTFCCPCGKSHRSYLPFEGSEASVKPLWRFDGNIDAPTVKPSILMLTPCKWHGFLTDGVFKEC